MVDDNLKLALYGNSDNAILDVIRQANEDLYIVTPYINIEKWGHAKDALQGAAMRGKVRIHVLLRANPGKPHPENDLEWLRKHNIPVKYLVGLHAKLYLNEQTAVLSSMNLMENSAMNSYDFALTVTQPGLHKQVRNYIDELIQLAAQGPANAAAAPVQSRLRRPSVPRSGGTCIVCGDAIDFKPEKPLCGEHYEKWITYNPIQRSDYRQNFCHSCGKREAVTFARPLCDACFRRDKGGMSGLFGGIFGRGRW